MCERARPCMQLVVASTCLSPQENRKIVIQRLHHVLLWTILNDVSLCHLELRNARGHGRWTILQDSMLMTLPCLDVRNLHDMYNGYR